MTQADGDAWDWDGVSWNYRGQTVGLPVFHTLAFDTIRGVAVMSGRGETWESCALDCADAVAPAAQAMIHAECACYAATNRYLTFAPPSSLTCDQRTALRVTFTAMPGASDCPRIADFSAFEGQQLWVGPEALSSSGAPTGVFRLQATPLFRDWSTVPGGVLQVSDCNIVPCATYTIESVTELGMSAGTFSPPLVLATTPTWGDIVGSGGGPANGFVDSLDIVAEIDRFKNSIGARPVHWCDVYGTQPNLSIDALDIVLVIDAYKGKDYPFAGPTAPNACP